MIGHYNTTRFTAKFSVWLYVLASLFLVLLPRTALAWSGPCIDVVDENRIVDGKHYTVVVIGDDTPGCDLYRVVKRFPQKDENGNELSVHEQLLSIYAVNGERTEDGEQRRRTVLRTCMQADPWPDTTPEEAAFCKHGYVNYPPNGFGGEILIPRTREMTPVERAFAVSKKACKKLDADGLTAEQDAELVAGCQKLNEDLAFVGKGAKSLNNKPHKESKKTDSEEVTVLKTKNEALQQEMAALQPLVRWGKYMPYTLGLLVFVVCLAGLFAVLYFKKSSRSDDADVDAHSADRDSVLAKALKESDELKQTQELALRLQVDIETAQGSLEKMTLERDAVQQELASERAKNAELEKSLAKNVAAGDELVRVNGRLQRELESVSVERDNYSEDLIRVTGEKEASELRVGELAKAELALKLQIEQGEQDLQTVNKQLTTAESRISQLESDISRFKFGSMRAAANLDSTVTSKSPLPELDKEDTISTVTSDDEPLRGEPIHRATEPIAEGFAEGFKLSGAYALVARTDGSLGALQSENSWHDIAGERNEAAGATIKPERIQDPISHFPLEVDPDAEQGILDGLVDTLFDVMKKARSAEVHRWRCLANEGGKSSVFLEQRLQQAVEALAKLEVLDGLDADEKASALAEILRQEQQNNSEEQSRSQLGNVLQKRLRTAPLRQVVATAMTCMMALAARQHDGESPNFVLDSMDEVVALHDFLNLPVTFEGNLASDLMHDQGTTVQLYRVGMPGRDRPLKSKESTHQPTIPQPPTFDPNATLVGVAPPKVEDDEGSGPRRRADASESRALSSADDDKGSDGGERSVS